MGLQGRLGYRGNFSLSRAARRVDSRIYLAYNTIKAVSVWLPKEFYFGLAGQITAFSFALKKKLGGTAFFVPPAFAAPHFLRRPVPPALPKRFPRMGHPREKTRPLLLAKGPCGFYNREGKRHAAQRLAPG